MQIDKNLNECEIKTWHLSSKEDQNKVLFAYEKYGSLGEDKEGIETVAYTWRSYKIGNTKTKHGVKIGYSGKLKTYAVMSGGKYYTNVKVTVHSGKSKLKNSQWKTRHSAYGLIGMNGKVPSLGIVYNGSIKGDKYSGSYSVEKTKNYTSLLPCYLKTWGTLTVKCKAGEFNMNTTVKSSWE